MVKKYKVTQELFLRGETYDPGTELSVKMICGILYVMDGCDKLFRLNSDLAHTYGEIVDRIY